MKIRLYLFWGALTAILVMTHLYKDHRREEQAAQLETEAAKNAEAKTDPAPNANPESPPNDPSLSRREKIKLQIKQIREEHDRTLIKIQEAKAAMAEAKSSQRDPSGADSTVTAIAEKLTALESESDEQIVSIKELEAELATNKGNDGNLPE